MLIKRNNSMTPKTRSVKKRGASALTALAICMASIAPNAFATSSPLVDRVVTVKFKLSELEAENGVKNVYARLMRKSKSYCRSDRSALDYLDQSVSECAGDLVNQFVKSADIDELTAYHLSQNGAASTQKLALN